MPVLSCSRMAGLAFGMLRISLRWMPGAAWSLAVPIGAASVSLPRDTVVSFQSSVVSRQASEPRVLAGILKTGD